MARPLRIECAGALHHLTSRVDRDVYLLELTPYVVLNPVRARMVEAPEQ